MQVHFFRVTPQATVYDSASVGCSFNSSVEDPSQEGTDRIGAGIGATSPSLSLSPSLGKNRQDSCSTACSCSTSASGSCCTSGSCCCTCPSVSTSGGRRQIRNFSVESEFGIRSRDLEMNDNQPSHLLQEDLNRNQVGWST